MKIIYLDKIKLKVKLITCKHNFYKALSIWVGTNY